MQDAVRFHLAPEDRLRAAGLGLRGVPLGDAHPLRVAVAALFAEGLHPLHRLLAVERAVAIDVVVKDGADVIAHDVLDDLEPAFVRQRDEVFVVLHPPIASVGVVRAIERFARDEVRVHIQKILRPIAVVAGLRPAEVRERIPHIAHGRSNPQRRDAELLEIARRNRLLQPTEIAAVILRDVALPGIVKRGVAPGGDVVRRVAIGKTIRQRKVDHVCIPRPGLRFLRGYGDERNGGEKKMSKHAALLHHGGEGWEVWGGQWICVISRKPLSPAVAIP